MTQKEVREYERIIEAAVEADSWFQCLTILRQGQPPTPPVAVPSVAGDVREAAALERAANEVLDWQGRVMMGHTHANAAHDETLSRIAESIRALAVPEATEERVKRALDAYRANMDRPPHVWMRAALVAVPVKVTEEMVYRAMNCWFGSVYPLAVSDDDFRIIMRKCLTAALT